MTFQKKPANLKLTKQITTTISEDTFERYIISVSGRIRAAMYFYER
jgi:hypothetical protein